jgi:anthranilate phosphoribosyltransferase
MQLRLSDPSYTDRLANFLRSLGQAAIVAGPGQLEVDLSPTGPTTAAELEIYLRVWRVLYPDAEVQLGGDDDGNDDPVPAA